MKITIDYGGCTWPLDLEQLPEHNLDLLMDTYTQPEVRTILNHNVEAFRAMIEEWNRRERAERRKAAEGSSP